ncbi:hypothetical protein, conserved [Angomonas deanei]|uniref:Flagellar attachment zone protein 1 conserved domain-containing protein n=1 Tax=Angomonas deanei TaxID=59799 RepID=A0A7G2CNM9_9TRYP|nr:hypothetical protein, conserved [Angomonas deanei]
MGEERDDRAVALLPQEGTKGPEEEEILPASTDVAKTPTKAMGEERDDRAVALLPQEGTKGPEEEEILPASTDVAKTPTKAMGEERGDRAIDLTNARGVEAGETDLARTPEAQLTSDEKVHATIENGDMTESPRKRKVRKDTSLGSAPSFIDVPNETSGVIYEGTVDLPTKERKKPTKNEETDGAVPLAAADEQPPKLCSEEMEPPQRSTREDEALPVLTGAEEHTQPASTELEKTPTKMMGEEPSNTPGEVDGARNVGAVETDLARTPEAELTGEHKERAAIESRDMKERPRKRKERKNASLGSAPSFVDVPNESSGVIYERNVDLPIKERKKKAGKPTKSESSDGAPPLAAADEQPPKLSSEEAELPRHTAVDEQPPKLSSEEAELPRHTAVDEQPPKLASEEAELPRQAAVDEQPPKLASEEAELPRHTAVDEQPPKLASEEAELPRHTAVDEQPPKLASEEAELPRHTAVDEQPPKLASEEAELPRHTAVDEQPPKLASEEAELPRHTAVDEQPPKLASEEAELPRHTAVDEQPPKLASEEAELPRHTAVDEQPPKLASEEAELPRHTAVDEQPPKLASEEAELPRHTAVDEQPPKLASEEAELPRQAAVEAEPRNLQPTKGSDDSPVLITTKHRVGFVGELWPKIIADQNAAFRACFCDDTKETLPYDFQFMTVDCNEKRGDTVVTFSVEHPSSVKSKSVDEILRAAPYDRVWKLYYDSEDPFATIVEPEFTTFHRVGFVGDKWGSVVEESWDELCRNFVGDSASVFDLGPERIRVVGYTCRENDIVLDFLAVHTETVDEKVLNGKLDSCAYKKVWDLYPTSRAGVPPSDIRRVEQICPNCRSTVDVKPTKRNLPPLKRTGPAAKRSNPVSEAKRSVDQLKPCPPKVRKNSARRPSSAARQRRRLNLRKLEEEIAEKQMQKEKEERQNQLEREARRSRLGSRTNTPYSRSQSTTLPLIK